MTLRQRRSSKKWPPRLSPVLPLLYLTPISYFVRYEILSDPNTREVYDSYGMAGLTGPGGAGPSGMNAEDLFAQFFGGTGATFGFDFGPGAGGPSRKRKGQDEVVPYDVVLEDLYNGKTVRINMEKDVACGACKGGVYNFSLSIPLCLISHYRTGARGNAKPKPCTKCEGKGWTYIQTQVRGSHRHSAHPLNYTRLLQIV